MLGGREMRDSLQLATAASMPAEQKPRRRRRWGGSVAALVAAVIAVSATGCGQLPDSFRPVTVQGSSIVGLFTFVMVLSALVFLLVLGLLGFAVVRFRWRGETDEPAQVHGNTRIEVLWTGGAFVLVTLLAALAFSTMTQVSASPPNALPVEVIGHQWWWEYRYPTHNVVTANALHLPLNTPVDLQITSNDVIHSFWVPQFGWQVDATPARVTHLPTHATETGTFSGACAEYCGTQHAWMRIQTVVEARDQFEAWLTRQQAPAASPSSPEAVRGQQLFQQYTCVTCHAIGGTTARAGVGPDLTHFGSRGTVGSGILANTPENLRRWVTNAQAVKPGSLMPSFQALSQADVDAVVAYLESLT